MKKLVVLAVGGNSLIKDKNHQTVADQYDAANETSKNVTDLLAAGYRVVVTHGNGRQVGFILPRSELSKNTLHEVPLDSCGADTQGAIGYHMAQTLMNQLNKKGLKIPVASVVTQVVVDRNDPGFKNPSKPIGVFYSEEEARKAEAEKGWTLKEDAGRGWRRVVASPEPVEIVEEEAIRTLVEKGMAVVAVGGGGIPVIRLENGDLQGTAAVIDKDRASCLLAKNIKADIFIISTAVPKVAINFNKPNQQFLDKMTVAEAKKYAAEGQFAPGSMLPKIEAAINFLEHGGEKVIITTPDLLGDAIGGKAGTHMTR